MFCKQCGKEVAEGAAFCPECGASLGGAPAPAPAPAPVAPAQVKTPPVGGPLESARANPLFFAAVICMSVVAFFQLIGMVDGANAMGQVSSMLSMVGAGGIGSGLSTMFILISLILLAITGVIVAGLWLCWVSGLDGSKAKLMGTGLKMIWAGLLSQLIFYAVVLGLADIILLIGAIAGGSALSGARGYGYYSSEANAAIGVLFLVFALVAAVLALMIVYYLKAMKSVKLAQVSNATGKLAGLPSMFVAVMTFVVAGFSLLSLLFGGFAGGALSVLNSLASIGANVLFGIVIIQFRNENTAVA